MALKRKPSSSAQVNDFHPSASPTSSSTVTDMSASAAEEIEMSVRREEEDGEFSEAALLKTINWSSDQASHMRVTLRVYNIPSPTSSTDGAEQHLPDSAALEMPMRKRRRTESFPKLLSLKTIKWSSSSDQASTHESHAEAGQKRKRKFLSAQVNNIPSPTSSTDGAEQHLPDSAALEMPVRKRRRTESFSKLLSLKTIKWSSSSDQASTHESHAEAGQKRKRNSLSAQVNNIPSPTSSTDGAEQHLPDSAALEMPVKEEEDGEFSKAPTISWSQEDHGLEVPPPLDPTVPRPPAPDGILSRYEIGRKLGEEDSAPSRRRRLEDGLEVAVKFARKPMNMKYINIPGHPTPLPLEVGLSILVNREPKAHEIIQLLDWQDQPEHYIMVLERPSPCEDLCKYLRRHGGILTEETAQYIMAQATMAAYTCCQRGVFHRDIKPENLLLNPETLEVKLIDFGCGDLLKDSAYQTFCGTRRFFPPEYFAFHKYHGRPATVWSLGVLLFVMMCGYFPNSRDLHMIELKIWSVPGLSYDCCDLIQSLLQQNPSQRIDLRDILQHEWFQVTE
ncbi:aurora kinase B-B-like [Puntigrus tetrazona]|uniref:aurora kinase B-B-like n=1 Tax=Puntigrus tetrazona TaxID=1606681 RepID=UPI001C89A0DA|nr:aurora kinase B-B-like [Puntigrus tetrazona]